MYISDKDFEKIEYLIGFVNTVAEIVCDPEEYLDPNTGDSPVFSIGYSVDNETLKISTLESEKVSDFKDNISDLETEVKYAVKTDFSEKWKEL